MMKKSKRSQRSYICEEKRTVLEADNISILDNTKKLKLTRKHFQDEPINNTQTSTSDYSDENTADLMNLVKSSDFNNLTDINSTDVILNDKTLRHEEGAMDKDSFSNETILTPKINSNMLFRKKLQINNSDIFDISRNSQDNESTFFSEKTLNTPQVNNVKLFQRKNKTLNFNISESSIGVQNDALSTDVSLQTPDVSLKKIFSKTQSNNLQNSLAKKKYQDKTVSFNVSRESVLSEEDNTLQILPQENTFLDTSKIRVDNLFTKTVQDKTINFNVSRNSVLSEDDNTRQIDISQENVTSSLESPEVRGGQLFSKKAEDKSVDFEVGRDSLLSEDDNTLQINRSQENVTSSLESPEVRGGQLFSKKAEDKSVDFEVGRDSLLSEDDNTLQINRSQENVTSCLESPEVRASQLFSKKAEDDSVNFEVGRDSLLSEDDSANQMNLHSHLKTPNVETKRMFYNKVQDKTANFEVSRDSRLSEDDSANQMNLHSHLKTPNVETKRMFYNKVQDKTANFEVSRDSRLSEDDSANQMNLHSHLETPNVETKRMFYNKVQDKTANFEVSRDSRLSEDDSASQMNLHSNLETPNVETKRMFYNKVQDKTVNFEISRDSRLSEDDSASQMNLYSHLETPNVETKRMFYNKVQDKTANFEVSRDSRLSEDEETAQQNDLRLLNPESFLGSLPDAGLNDTDQSCGPDDLLHSLEDLTHHDKEKDPSSFNSSYNDENLNIKNSLIPEDKNIPGSDQESDHEDIEHYWQRKYEALVADVKQKFQEKKNEYLKVIPDNKKKLPANNEKNKPKKVSNRRRKCPGNFVTNRLYRYVTNKLKNEHKSNAKVKAEEFIEFLATVVKTVERRNTYQRKMINDLKKEMAVLKIIETHWDFYRFVWDYLPGSFRNKVIPAYQPGSNVVWPPRDVTDEKEKILT